jgi:histidinol-phosphate/aromatic aminotransferase/cobyric acid decarboxylase-like protein
VIDETYVDFVESGTSMEGDVATHDNLVILKSMSKVYALSGARVGYLVASERRVEELAARTPPWSVSFFGQVAAIEALRDGAYYESRIRETHALRTVMIEQLRTIPAVEVFESVTGYFLMCLKAHGASVLIEALQKEKILLTLKLRRRRAFPLSQGMQVVIGQTSPDAACAC